jgi:hypothetical protein
MQPLLYAKRRNTYPYLCILKDQVLLFLSYQVLFDIGFQHPLQLLSLSSVLVQISLDPLTLC